MEQTASLKPITLKVKNESVENVLKRVFEKTGFTYNIERNTVIISKRQKGRYTLSGTVYVNQKGWMPLSYVNILLPQFSTGTMSDENGKFELRDLPDGPVNLVVSSLGMENANSYVNQNYYLLYGLGKSVEKIGSGRFTEYSANTLGSGLQYNYSGRTKVLWDANYSMKVEDLKENSTSPKNDGTTRDGIFTTNLRLVTNPEKAYSSYIYLGYQDRRISGIEYHNLEQ